jgi:hypothetical protein
MKIQLTLYMFVLWEHQPLPRILPQESDGEDDDLLRVGLKIVREPTRKDDKSGCNSAAYIYRFRAPRRLCSQRTNYSRTE